jgi:DNA-binding MarR family transcriptional regulator
MKKQNMPRRLELAEQVFVDLVKTHSEKMCAARALLSPYGLSDSQYNVLRILRGAQDRGLPSGEIADRLLTRCPDTTRLIDRLEKEGYVARDRPGDDRRVVVIRITAKGLTLLASLDEPVVEMHREQFAALTTTELRQLMSLLAKARSR